MRVGSLFTGIGGFDLGFERAGFEVAWQCEIDKHASQVLDSHWPTVLRMEDVRWLNGALVDAVDVLVGGFPCQDLSVAGRRAGLAGERSGLWFEFHRIASELRPNFIVIENVPGLLSSNGGADFGVVLRGLVELGYRVCWRILDAQYFGVAQRRRRVFIVGSLGDGRAATILLEPESMSGNSQACSEGEESVATRTPHRTLTAAGSRTVHSHIVGALDTESGGTRLTLQTAASGHLLPTGPYWDGSDTAATLDVSALVKRQTMPEKNRLAAVITSGVRRLTPVECERLQGFPDNWTAIGADVHRYRQLGNAVAVPVAEWLARRIKENSRD